MTSTAPPTTFIRDLYARMLLTRIVDDYAWRLYKEGRIDFIASCRGHEAAQVGSAVCIEVRKDFTLPYYRDLGVVLTIGMTPYEVFRTYLLAHRQNSPLGEMDQHGKQYAPLRYWDYHKHNIVTGPTPVAIQLLHAAGIAFANKLRKASVVTVAYCDNEATTEPDFLEAIRFASLHQLPVVFICEQDSIQPRTDTSLPPSGIEGLALPAGLTHQYIDGSNVVTVYAAMGSAMQRARQGQGPTLIEMHITRLLPNLDMHTVQEESNTNGTRECDDPLVHCKHYLQTQGAWDEEWAKLLCTRLSSEVESALQDAIRDTHQT
ncbi:MAG TPA: thiamine pyrophosphate-dependent dehydrogenase E1 component subunit alpha, partial [Ktedonobacteraceae bacterium]